MARPKRDVILIDDHIWTHEGMRSLSDSAALAYIYLIAWSKAMKRQGVVTPIGAKFCDAGPAELEELLNARPEPFLDLHPEGWRILKWDEWQVASDTALQTEQARVLGARGGEAKRDNAAARQEEVEAGLAEPVEAREAWLASVFPEWPGPSNGFAPENPRNVRPSFLDNVKTAADWEKFRLALDARLSSYKADPRQKTEKRQFLGSFKNFCLKWRDWVPLAAPPPAEPEAPRVFKTVVDDGKAI